jgi:hypothetical protein
MQLSIAEHKSELKLHERRRKKVAMDKERDREKRNSNNLSEP